MPDTASVSIVRAEHRPTGVTILAVLALVTGALALVTGITLLAAGTITRMAGAASESGVLGALGIVGSIAGIAMILYGAFVLTVSYGLFTRRRWAWFATVVVVLLQGLFAIGSVLSGDVFSAIVGITIAVALVWYLLSPPVQQWFGVSYQTPWHYRGPPPHA